LKRLEQKLERPVRSQGENQMDWVLRRNQYQITTLEQQVQQLQTQIKRLEAKCRK